MNISFNSDLAVLLGSASDEFGNVVEVKREKKISSLTNLENTQKKRGFNQTLDQVEDIKPPTTSKRKLWQNRCPNKLRNLR